MSTDPTTLLPAPSDHGVEVTHALWSDRLVLKGENFRRENTNCGGKVEELGEGYRILRWSSWNPEILTPDNRVISESEYFLEHPKVEPTLDALGLPRPIKPLPTPVRACLLTYSRNRLNYLCALIGCMRIQTESKFVQILHLIDYTKDQIKFIESMIDGDERFIVRLAKPAHQKGQLRRILSESLIQKSPFYIKIDDDDIYAPRFLEDILQHASGHDLCCCQSMIYHYAHQRSSHLQTRSQLFGNNMCFSRGAVEFLLSQEDSPKWEFEDAQAHHQLVMAGMKVNLFSTDPPQMLYLRHGKNIS